MNRDPRITLLETIFNAFTTRGDVEPLLAACTDDVTIRLTILPGTPLSGEFVGKDGLVRYFMRSAETVVTTDVTVASFLAGGDQVAVVGSETIKVLRSGETHTGCEWITLFTFRGSSIAYILVVEDTARISAAYA